MSLFKSKKDEPAKVLYDEPTPEQLQKIKSATWEKCYEYWNSLNTWGWPDDLLPSDGSTCTNPYTGYSVRSQLMRVIERKVGMKYILRQWNVFVKPEFSDGLYNQKRMTESEFEDWWPSSNSFNKSL